MSSGNDEAPSDQARPNPQEMLLALLNHKDTDPNTLIMGMFGSITQMLGSGNTEKRELCFKKFMSFKPPSFYGSTNPIEAEQWLDEMERIFNLLRGQTTTQDQVDLATYMLKGEAIHWWREVQKRYTEGESVGWEEFKDQLLAKYFPPNARYRMEREFLNLTQGNKTILQYEQEFDKLSRYAGPLVADEAAKTRRFIEGLIPPIRKMIVSHGIEIFRKAVDMAEVCEQEDARDKAAKDEMADRKRRIEQSGPPTHAKQNQSSQLQTQPKPIGCYKCGGRHKTSKCRKDDNVCYRCKQLGHYIADCEAPPSYQAARDTPPLLSRRPNRAFQNQSHTNKRKFNANRTKACSSKA